MYIFDFLNKLRYFNKSMFNINRIISIYMQEFVKSKRISIYNMIIMSVKIKQCLNYDLISFPNFYKFFLEETHLKLFYDNFSMSYLIIH